MRDHRADRWVFQRRRRTIAREHIMRAAFMGRFTVGHRANDGNFISDLRGVFHEFAKLHAGNFCVDRAKWPTVF